MCDTGARFTSCIQMLNCYVKKNTISNCCTSESFIKHVYLSLENLPPIHSRFLKQGADLSVSPHTQERFWGSPFCVRSRAWSGITCTRIFEFFTQIFYVIVQDVDAKPPCILWRLVIS